MTKPIEESRLVDLSDDALLEMIGYLWESIKLTDERMKSDQNIQRMEEELKEYKNLNYSDAKRTYKAKLKAARKHAQARGLSFNLPEGVDL